MTRLFTYCSKVLWATIFASIFAVQQHLLHAVASPLHKLQHVEGLAGEKLAVVCGLSHSSHELVKVTLLHTQEPRHPEDVIPTDLRLPKAVVVAEGDGREVHDRAVHLVQDGHMRVPIVLDHAVGHLVEEDGEGCAEGGGPKQPPQSHSTGKKNVAETMEGTVGPKHCDVRWWTWFFLFWDAHYDYKVSLFWSYGRRLAAAATD